MEALRSLKPARKRKISRRKLVLKTYFPQQLKYLAQVQSDKGDYEQGYAEINATPKMQRSHYAMLQRLSMFHKLIAEANKIVMSPVTLLLSANNSIKLLVTMHHAVWDENGSSFDV